MEALEPRFLLSTASTNRPDAPAAPSAETAPTPPVPIPLKFAPNAPASPSSGASATADTRITYASSITTGGPATDFLIPASDAQEIVVKLDLEGPSDPFDAEIDVVSENGRVVTRGIMTAGMGEVTLTHIPREDHSVKPSRIDISVAPESTPAAPAPPTTYSYVLDVIFSSGRASTPEDGSSGAPPGPSAGGSRGWAVDLGANPPPSSSWTPMDPPMAASGPFSVLTGPGEGSAQGDPGSMNPANDPPPAAGTGTAGHPPIPPIGVSNLPTGPAPNGPGGGQVPDGPPLPRSPGQASPPGAGGDAANPLPIGGTPTPTDVHRPAPVDLATADPSLLASEMIAALADPDPADPTDAAPEPWDAAPSGPRRVVVASAAAVPIRIAPLLLTAPVEGPEDDVPDAAPSAPGRSPETSGAHPVVPESQPLDPPSPAPTTDLAVGGAVTDAEGGGPADPDREDQLAPASGRVGPILAGLGGSTALLTGLLIPDLNAAIRPVLDAHRRLRRSSFGRRPRPAG